MFRRMREKRQEIVDWQVASGLCCAHSDSAGPFLRELSQRPSGSVESINRALVFAPFPLAHAGAHYNATRRSSSQYIWSLQELRTSYFKQRAREKLGTSRVQP